MNKIGKIIELQVETEDLEFSSDGLEMISLVEEPAIGVHWAVFAAEQFVDKQVGESKDDYISRCIPKLIKEGYDEEQSAAICYSSFEENRENDQAMIDGIVDLLIKVEDLDNRLAMAKDVVKDFNEEGILFDLTDFMNRVGFHSFEIDTDGLPNYVDEDEKLKAEEEEYRNRILEMASQSDFGETLDVEMTTYVNLSKSKFETIGEYLRGIDALDLLENSRNNGYEQMPEPSYRYTGSLSPNSRAFCIALIGLNKIYSRGDIADMDRINRGFGPSTGDKNDYNVFEYKGGSFCQHYWEQLRVIKGSNGRNIVISEGPVTGSTTEFKNAGKSNNYGAASPNGVVSNEASIKFSKSWSFAEDDDKHIVTGPAMKSFQMIPRRDDDGNIFHVYFSDETIRKLSEKFLKEHKQNMTDINHSMDANEENTLIESWIVEDPDNDKANALGFNPSKGDWYVSYKINNEDTWKKIKEGELQGFSIAGEFLERNTK